MLATLDRLVPKIHRANVLVIITLSLIMAGTGLLLKYPAIADSITLIDLGLVRYLHNQISVLFVASLLVMILSGLYMFAWSWIHRHQRKEH